MQPHKALRYLSQHDMRPVLNSDGSITAESSAVLRDGSVVAEFETFRPDDSGEFSLKQICDWLGY